MHKELLQLQFFLLYSVISKVICEVTKQRSRCVNCMLAFRQHNRMEPRAQYNYTRMFTENGLSTVYYTTSPVPVTTRAVRVAGYSLHSVIWGRQPTLTSYDVLAEINGW